MRINPPVGTQQRTGSEIAWIKAEPFKASFVHLSRKTHKRLCHPGFIKNARCLTMINVFQARSCLHHVPSVPSDSLDICSNVFARLYFVFVFSCTYAFRECRLPGGDRHMPDHGTRVWYSADRIRTEAMPRRELGREAR